MTKKYIAVMVLIHKSNVKIHKKMIKALMKLETLVVGKFV